MNSFEDYFDRIFCINLDRSQDRWADCVVEFEKFGLKKVERFRAYDFHDYDRMPGEFRMPMSNAMRGCTQSHSAIIHAAAWNGWGRTLILEDDFKIVHEDFHERWAAMLPFIPDDWDLLYLGAHYGGPPISRINKHIVRGNNLKTTSSYAITASYARFLVPYLSGSAGTDDIISGLNTVFKAYVLQPRLMVQRESVSIIWGNLTNNGDCMMDTRHESMV